MPLDIIKFSPLNQSLRKKKQQKPDLIVFLRYPMTQMTQLLFLYTISSLAIPTQLATEGEQNDVAIQDTRSSHFLEQRG